MSTPSDAWAELRAALAEPAEELTFRAVCAILDTWPGPGRDEALAHAAGVMTDWPDAVRVAPWTWLCAALAGEDKPSWPLVRALRTSSGRCGCDEIPVRSLGTLRAWHHVTRLEVTGYTWLRGLDDATAVATATDLWPGLRHFGRVWFPAREVQPFARFLASDLPHQLESLHLVAPVGATGDLRWPLPLAHLHRLHLTVHGRCGAGALLRADRLPNLADLRLTNDGYLNEGWMEPAHWDNLNQLLGADVYPQLTGLELWGFPNAWMAALFERGPWHLDRLALTNRPYTPFQVEFQQLSCRLGAEAVRAAVGAGVCRNLTRLRVKHNRAGAEVLKLVGATTPGRLTHLELVDVDLRDGMAEELARMPQLAGLTHLDLSRSHLTTAGVAALARSPHLGKLRHLNLSGEVYDPYYGGYEERPQPFLNRGLAGLLSAPLLQGLETLRLADANLGPDGAAALAQAPPALRDLDLSLNPLRAEGVPSLTRSPAMTALRRLDLMGCGLDDAAVAHLAAAPFRHLRELNLGYNRIGREGVARLAEAPGLAGLWRLDLADNQFGNLGLMALARSPYLTRLVELVTERDVFNPHRGGSYGPRAAAAFARSKTFGRLDAFFGGVMDAYHGSRPAHAFRPEGVALVGAAANLRPEVRHGIATMRAEPPEDRQG